MLVDTMCHHLWKLDVFHDFLLHLHEPLSNKRISFLGFMLKSARICLFSGSITTHNQMNSNPTLSNVSSMINSEILFLFDNIFLG